MHVLILISMS
jgi:hypothetical protein